MIGICLFVSDPTEQLWYWDYNGKKAYMDLNESIRFRVYADQFIDHPPVSKDAQLSLASKKATLDPGSVSMVQKSDTKILGTTSIAPYIIYASIAEEGLGLLSWWSKSIQN